MTIEEIERKQNDNLVKHLTSSITRVSHFSGAADVDTGMRNDQPLVKWRFLA